MKNSRKTWEMAVTSSPFVVLGIIGSAVFTTYGISTLVFTMLEKTVYMILAVSAVFTIFLIIERIRSLSLDSWLTSTLSRRLEGFFIDKNYRPTKVKWISAISGVFLTLAILGSDIFGAYALRDLVQRELVAHYVNDDMAYQKEVEDLKSGRTDIVSYNDSISVWTVKREGQLAKWETDKLEAKREWENSKNNAYAQCNINYKLSKHFYTANRKCKEAWSSKSENVYVALAKPTELPKPIKTELASGAETVTIGGSIVLVSANATKWAEPFSFASMVFFVFIAMVLSGLAVRGLYVEYDEKADAIDEFYSIYEAEYDNYKEVERSRKQEKSKVAGDEAVDIMKAEVDADKKISSIKVDSFKRKMEAKVTITKEQAGNLDKLNNYWKGKRRIEIEVHQTIPQQLEKKEEHRGQEAAQRGENDKPIGFRVGDEATEQPLAQTEKPTYRENSYFDEGYDLTVAIYCLFDYGRIEADMELPSNKILKTIYDKSPFKRSELKENQISALVRSPLKEKSLIIGENGYKDIAQYNLDEVLSELGLLEYAAEITLKKKDVA